MMPIRKTFISLIFILILFSLKVNAQTFLKDDPIQVDPDMMNIVAPKESHHSEYYDFYLNSFVFPGKIHEGPAQNVNTLGEVPNSSWFTNRHYFNRMTTEQLAKGPNSSNGPSIDGTWEIIQGKSQGITPGFTIKDSESDVYFIKFDPPGYQEMTTSSEIISTKFFHALGYFVPENYIVQFQSDILKLNPDATTKDAMGNKKPLTEYDVREMLSKAFKDEHGYFRAIASKRLTGKPLGPFLYYSARPDDANDIFPHESRRELRGLRIFCAWLNHDDARAINSLDMLVQSQGNQFVKHYLIDFGSTLGSGSVLPQNPRAGNEFILEYAPILKGMFSLGLWVRPWAKVEYPHYPSIGRIEGDFFRPEEWKTEYPNPAFLNCDATDAFWAAKQVMNFSDNDIRAIVRSGKLTNAEAENYLVETLKKRRDKIGKAYLSFSGGIDKFVVAEDQQLNFTDLLAEFGLNASPKLRNIIWKKFDNESGKSGEKIQSFESKETVLPIPQSESVFLQCTIETPAMGQTDVFLRKEGSTFVIVGLRRY